MEKVLICLLSILLFSCSTDIDEELSTPTVSKRTDACSQIVTATYVNNLLSFIDAQNGGGNQMHLADIHLSSDGEWEFRILIADDSGTTVSNSGFIVEQNLQGVVFEDDEGSSSVIINLALVHQLIGDKPEGFMVEEDLVGWKLAYKPSDLCQSLSTAFIVEDGLEGW